MGWLERERGLDLADYDALWRWSVTDLEGFWSSLWDFFEVRAHTPYEQVLGSREMPGAEWFPGARLELRRAHARPRRRPGRGRGRRALADARAVRAHVRRAPRAGGARPCRAAAARGGRGRPSGRVPAEHPGDARRVPRLREPRRDLGDVSARVRRAQRPPPPRPARAEAAARGRGVQVGERLVDRREQVAEVRDGLPSLEAVVEVPYPEHGLCRHGLLGRAPGGRRPARVRAAAVRAPALRALLVGHDRPAEGDRARPRRDSARASEEPRAQLGPEARRPAAVVHDDGLDDVERARFDAAAARVGRDDRRQPGAPRPLVPVGSRQGDEADDARRQPGLRHRLPQGGPRARPALRPLADSVDRRRRLAAPGRRVRVALRPARPQGVHQPGQRGDRHPCTGIVQGYPLLPVYAGEMSRTLPRRGRAVVLAATGSWSSAGSASRDRAADALDAGRALERPDLAHAPPFDHFPGVLRHGDGSCSPSAAVGRSPAL